MGLTDEVNYSNKKGQSNTHILLLLSVFVIATCGLIYELIAGTLASYLLGDSILQFSTIIGTYLFSMGVGSWLSKYIDGDLMRWFIRIELLVGVVGGLSAPALFIAFEHVASFRFLLYGFVGITGVLVGLEIPVLMRILKNNYTFKNLVSDVFTFDYVGGLLASLIFPLLLVPYLGLIRTSLFFGFLNMVIAFMLLFKFDETKAYRRSFTLTIAAFLAMFVVCFIYANKIMTYTESMSFQDNVIYSKSTPYQRMVITRNNRELRLFLNGNLQFSSADEYRYHEALVHPGMQALPHAERVLVLGGGDGLAVRELLKYPQLKSITLVDLDPGMTDLFRKNAMLTSLNKGSLLSPKVKVINTDAYQWVRNDTVKYQFIIADFPDPSNYSIGKLYTATFYNELRRLLDDNGVMVVQSTSPYIGRRSFWCVDHTIAAAGFFTIPYHAYVPSFGEWGYILATKNYSWRAHYLWG
jgi:spermidine synthase